MKTHILLFMAMVMTTTMALGQNTSNNNSAKDQAIGVVSFPRHHIGSSLLVLSNFFSDPADYYQLSYGYHHTQRDIFKIEAITWKYNEPLGTYGDSEEVYPGKVKAYGVGVGYQRFHWKNAFTTFIATPFLQQFYDVEKIKIQKGFQLYLQFIAGYRIEIFKKRLFIEPAYAFKYWPVNTNFPEGFAAIEAGENNYKVEMSLNFGYRF